jgi:hypothetical protein
MPVLEPLHEAVEIIHEKTADSQPHGNKLYPVLISSWRMSSSGMWCRVDLVLTDVLEERIASISGYKKSTTEEPAWAGGCRHTYSNGEWKFSNYEISCYNNNGLPSVKICINGSYVRTRTIELPFASLIHVYFVDIHIFLTELLKCS